MTETNLSQQNDLGGIVSNAYGEHALFGINRNLFQGTDASTVFRTHFGDSLFEENTFYIMAGTDSGLLYQYIKSQGVPKGSHYLFVELPQVLALLNDMDDPEAGLSVTDKENWQQRANDLNMLDYAIQERLILHRSLGVIHAHCRDYSPFWRQIQEEYNSFMEKQRIALNNKPFTVRQIENLSENHIPAICLKGIFSGKTAVVLAGGPSLDDVLPWVQEHRQNLLVIAVSRISQSLLHANIQPDIIVSVDPYPINLYVSREMMKFQDNALLLNEFHLSSNLLAAWGGKKVYMGKRYPWPTPREPENLPPTVGNTVTNTAVAIAIEMGIAQIVLGGADFCFSAEGYTHASGSAEHALGSRPVYGNKRVVTNCGKMADSNDQFMGSAETINYQASIALKQGCLTINPAPGAMRLSQVEHLPLEIIQFEPMEKPAQEIIAANLPASEESNQTRHYEENLSEVDRVLDELRTIRELSRNALKYSRRFFNKNEKGAGFHNNVKLQQIEKQFKEKYADTTSLMKHFGIQRLIPIIRHNEQHKDDVEENDRLHFQAMTDIATDLTEILQQARSRIVCRIEENKPQPNMQRLFSQWRTDHQLGRGIQWAQQHSNIVKELPVELQQELYAFQEQYEDYIQKLGQIYYNGIEKGVSLDGLNARAREYFQCQDKEGLLNLLTGLNMHREPEQANLFIPLVQGYLDEINNEPQVAIKTYEQLTEGPAHIDVLMRLFELYTRDKNFHSSLEVLKKLSDISTTYIPMYADMLQANGDVEAALEIYTDYLLNNPDDLVTMMKLGKLYEQCGSAEGVTMAMNYILDKDPDNHTAKTMLISLRQSQANDK